MKQDLRRLLTKRAVDAVRSAVSPQSGGVVASSDNPAQEVNQGEVWKQPAGDPRRKLSEGEFAQKARSGNVVSAPAPGWMDSVRNYHGNLAAHTDMADPNKSMRSQLGQNLLRGGAHAVDFLAGIGSSVADNAASAGESTSRAFNSEHGDNTLWNGAKSIGGALIGNEKNMGDTWNRIKRGGGQMWNSWAGDLAGAAGYGAMVAGSLSPAAWGAKGVGLAANASRLARIGANPITRGAMFGAQALNTAGSGVSGARAPAPAEQQGYPAQPDVASNEQQAVQPVQQNGQGFDWSQLRALAPMFMGAMGGGQGGYGMQPQQDQWSQFANRPASSYYYYYPAQTMYGS